MQGDGPFPDGINVTIRRNYIYEDAYDKLSPENGASARRAHAGTAEEKTLTPKLVKKIVNFRNSGSVEGAEALRRGLKFGEA